MYRPNNILKVSGRGGQTLVEFALIVGLILALLFGIMEFARAWQYTNALTNGVRDGARFASTIQGPNFKTEVQNYTFSLITSAIPNDPSLVIDVLKNSSSIPPASGESFKSSDTVTVTASCDFDILTGSIIPFFSGTKTLVREATMSHE